MANSDYKQGQKDAGQGKGPQNLPPSTPSKQKEDYNAGYKNPPKK
jgi:hypothetical protein